jgi:gluconolactonase
VNLSDCNIKVEEIAALPFYTEGPVIGNDGNVYVTTLSGGGILRIDAAGRVSEWARSTWPNGQAVLPDGDHLICDCKQGAISRFSPEGIFREHVLQGRCAGQPVHTPSDIIIEQGAGFYFSDGIRESGAVFFAGMNGIQQVVARNMDAPNGLALSAGRDMLYIAESYRNRILRVKLREPGIAEGEPEVWCDLPQNPSGGTTAQLPDGLKLDSEGRLWVAHYGMGALQVISPGGRLLGTIDTRLPLTSNLLLMEEKDRVTVIVTGGYGEPSPGAVMKIIIQSR